MAQESDALQKANFIVIIIKPGIQMVCPNPRKEIKRRQHLFLAGIIPF